MEYFDADLHIPTTFACGHRYTIIYEMLHRNSILLVSVLIVVACLT